MKTKAKNSRKLRKLTKKKSASLAGLPRVLHDSVVGGRDSILASYMASRYRVANE